MKKRTPVILVLIFLAVHDRVDADEFAGAMPILSVLHTLEFVPGQRDFEKINLMYGLGVKVPFLFRKEQPHNMIAPALTVEYNFDNLLRIRTGLHVGKMPETGLFFFDYYIGVSGIYMHDFAYDITTIGIAPEIGFEVFILLFMYLRVQLQYDFLSVERYNRYACNISFIIPLKVGP
ncbi:MAG: hypothetical protein LBG79_07845 [Spirochaetaceae bacterium]|jgi:hypothetical protein|nr:hypothetical protein [Spirochaetaceae bacterium]